MEGQFEIYSHNLKEEMKERQSMSMGSEETDDEECKQIEDAIAELKSDRMRD